jgi:hypothetical protein
MIHVEISLQCEDCKRFFAGTKTVYDVVFRNDLVGLRAAAREAGWRRFRPRNNAGNCDYCPRCAAERDDAKKGSRKNGAVTKR